MLPLAPLLLDPWHSAFTNVNYCTRSKARISLQWPVENIKSGLTEHLHPSSRWQLLLALTNSGYAVVNAECLLPNWLYVAIGSIRKVVIGHAIYSGQCTKGIARYF